MSLKKLPNEIQLLVCASRVNNYKNAVEELVYNALDAEATSIALRLDIPEQFIQVIDNGTGMTEQNMRHVGKKYMTSKIVDLETMKSAPNTYGYRGQALSSIVEVSSCVKITSKHECSEEAWSKIFCEGKEETVLISCRRASKGTTIEIRGFLYNLHIQKKSINALKEILDIKKNLQCLSLIRNNISISLRDDSKNEIVFQIHKSRDTFQTLKSLFNIDKDEVQELKVEKNKYRVTAFISKKVNESNLETHWIYLNGRFIDNCRVNKIMDKNLSKLLFPGKKGNNIYKVNNPFNTEEVVNSKRKLPFYFLFISCPYNDYDFNDGTTQAEFKNWHQVTRLLEKLARFYTGDVTLKKERVEKRSIKTANHFKDVDTRDEVKKIMQKILASNSRTLGVSQMHNGVKGKLTKRNKKKKLDITLSKIVLKSNSPETETLREDELPANLIQNSIDERVHDNARNINHNFKRNQEEIREQSTLNLRKQQPIVKKKAKSQRPHNSNNRICKPKLLTQNNLTKKLLEKFTHQNEKVQQRCKMISEKAKDKLLQYQIGPRQKITSQYTNITCNGHFTMTKKKYESSIHKEIPNQIKFDEKSFTNLVTHERKVFTTEHTLNINDIYNTTDFSDFLAQRKNILKTFDCNLPSVESHGPPLTFNSHTHYDKNAIGISNRIKPDTHFIGKQSRDNFEKYEKLIRNNESKKNNYKKSIFKNIEHSSYTIEFSNTNKAKEKPNVQFEDKAINTTQRPQNFDISQKSIILGNNRLNEKHVSYKISSTYTVNKAETSSKSYISDSQEMVNPNNHSNFEDPITTNNSTEALLSEPEEVKMSNYFKNTLQDLNIVFVSKSQNKSSYSSEFNPVDLCETVMDISDEEVNHLPDAKHNLQNDSIDVISFLSDAMATYNAVEEKSCNSKQIINCHKNTGPLQNNLAETMEINVDTIDTENVDALQYNKDKTIDVKEDTVNATMAVMKNFALKNRPRFIPKGLSPIFANCNNKHACNFNLDEEYFNDSMYKEFLNTVQTNTEAFESNVECVNKMAATRDIGKVKARINKDNASLSFEGSCLYDAKVLGQVDNKFVAAKIKGISRSDATYNEYLVMFDQHAVHERIRLEDNLAEYLTNNHWKSIPIDNVTLKMNRDILMHLHNYKNKFTQLGLNWNVLSDCEITLTSIPEAVIGKNVRQVDVIIKAIKNLILEEIEILKTQKGSISIYPKSIMDLVFSEACRYAIKFGDKLSKSQCVELLQQLSRCKTPFQCAHGRPAMAVLFDVVGKYPDYEINYEKLKKFIAKK